MTPISEAKMLMEDCAIITTSMEIEGHLGLFPPIDPIAAQDRIEQAARQYRKGTFDGQSIEDPVTALGALWGSMIVLAYNWDWVAVESGSWRGLGVSDKERRYLVLPINLFHKLLNDDPQEALPGAAVRFKAIGADYLPASKPGEFLILD